MWILEELIRHAKAKGKGKVWCGTHRQGRAGPGRTGDFALSPFGGAAFLRAAQSNQGAAGQEAAIHYDAFAIDEIRRARGEEGDCSGYVARVASSSTWDHRQKQLPVLLGDLVLAHFDEPGRDRVRAELVSRTASQAASGMSNSAWSG
jgi:hypothetical protein